MEKDKISENVEFDVLYADDTKRHVPEGILFGVEEDTMVFHNGTNLATVLFAAAEAALCLIDNIGLTKLFGMYIRSDPEDEATVQILHRLAKDPESASSAMKQALFRLGQMDMRESIAAMLQEEGDSLYGMARAALLDAAERVRGMEVKL